MREREKQKQDVPASSPSSSSSSASSEYPPAVSSSSSSPSPSSIPPPSSSSEDDLGRPGPRVLANRIVDREEDGRPPPDVIVIVVFDDGNNDADDTDAPTRRARRLPTKATTEEWGGIATNDVVGHGRDAATRNVVSRSNRVDDDDVDGDDEDDVGVERIDDEPMMRVNFWRGVLLL